MIKSYAHVCISARDLDESAAFYIRGLGLEHVFDFYRGKRKVGTYLALPDGSFLEIFEKPDMNPVNEGIRHFCFLTDSIDEVIRECSALDIECSPKIKAADGTFQTWVTDPSGNRIELHQYTDDSAQTTKKDVRLE